MGQPTSSGEETQAPCKESTLILRKIQAYISGKALNILTGPYTLVQTIYQDECNVFESVAFSDSTGKLATCDTKSAYIYRPYGREEGALKVACAPRNEFARF